jgi:hypothetical protein
VRPIEHLLNHSKALDKLGAFTTLRRARLQRRGGAAAG